MMGLAPGNGQRPAWERLDDTAVFEDETSVRKQPPQQRNPPSYDELSRGLKTLSRAERITTHDLVSLRWIDELLNGYVLQHISLSLKCELATNVSMLLLVEGLAQVFEEERRFWC